MPPFRRFAGLTARYAASPPDCGGFAAARKR